MDLGSEIKVSVHGRCSHCMFAECKHWEKLVIGTHSGVLIRSVPLGSRWMCGAMSRIGPDRISTRVWKFLTSSHWPQGGLLILSKKDKYCHTVMLMEMDGREWKSKRTKSRDERKSVSTLTVDRRLQHNCFPHDCRYRVSKTKQTDLDRKVTAPLNLRLPLM